MIAEHVWNLDFDTFTNVIDVYVNYLAEQDRPRAGPQADSNDPRQRLRAKGSNVVPVKSGIGYVCFDRLFVRTNP